MRAGTSGRGANLCNQMLDLAFGPKARSGKQLGVIFERQIRRQQQESGEVNGPLGEHLEQQRKRPRHARRACAPLRFVFGQPELVNTIRVQRRTRALAVNPARVHLGKVREQLGREPIVPPRERLHPRMKRLVRNVLELVAPRATRPRRSGSSERGGVRGQSGPWRRNQAR